MKLRNIFALTLTIVLAAAMLTGCGGSAKSYAADTTAQAETWAASNSLIESPAEMEEAGILYDAGSGSTAEGEDASAVLPEGRKWIVTMTLSAETEDLDAMTAALNGKIAALGGFVEDQSVYNGSAYGGRRYRSASLTVRIPAADADKFTEELAGISNVVRKEKNLEDITLQYVDTDSRKKALETERDRLLELLAQAETMSDLLEIEGRLTEVRAELETAASRLRLYDNQVDYATIYLDISEVQEYTPVEEPTFFERISTGFTASLRGLWTSLKDLTVWLIASLPYILVYGGLAAGLIAIARTIRKKHPKKPKKSKPDASQAPDEAAK